MRRSPFLIGPLLLGLAAWAQPSSTTFAPAANPATNPGVDQPDADFAGLVAARVRREMEAQRLVGLAISFADRSGIEHTACFGLADRGAELPVTPETMFRWASISKPMTAVVAMQLWSEGKLDLDADVRLLVPEFPEKPFPITARQLLCHQGGIVHYTNGPVVRTAREYDEEHPFRDTILALDAFKESPLVSEPGKAYNYTTHGYMLLGAAVQRAAGEPFAEVVRDRIARPLGMTTLRPDYQWEDIPNRAKGYRIARDSYFPSGESDVSWKLPGGGWISTVDDLARFGAGMLGEALVGEEVRGLMWTPQALVDGTATSYGLGFVLGRGRHGAEVSHSGAQEKTRTMLFILPEAGEEGAVVAVMCNTEGARLDALARDLATMFIEARAPAGR